MSCQLLFRAVDGGKVDTKRELKRMRKRKVIENFAEGFISSFISRSNDMDGYWAIGKLCTHALQQRTNAISIDLLKKEILPKNAKFDPAMHSWSEAIKHKFGEPRFRKNWLASAIINLEFKNMCLKRQPNMRSALIQCRCIVE